MSSDAQVIKDLSIQASGIIADKNGMEYSKTQLHPVYHDPSPEALVVQTLSGLCEYIKQKIEEIKSHGCFVLIDDAQNVRLLSGLHDLSMKRKTFIRAKFQRDSGFEFGHWIQHEEFLIRLNSQFTDAGSRKELTEFISKIHTSEGVSTEDDGVTQIATLKSGLSGALKENKSAPSRVMLSPFRTFQEITQPSSEFLFRMKKTRDDYGNGRHGVSCALFKSDGDIWQQKCCAEIAEWIKNQLKDWSPDAAEIKVIY